MDTIMIYRCDLALADNAKLPESMVDKLELYDLWLSLRPIPPFIGLNMDEYLLIKDILVMDRIQIRTTDYYGNPSYYSVMPEPIFSALEQASLQGDEYTEVDKNQFNEMINAHKIKIQKWEKTS